MGDRIHLAIEAKFFSVFLEGSFMSIIEKTWKVANMVKLAFNMTHWLSKSLENSVSKDFYSFVREGN